jgi:epsilon-lactone hydrolase
LIMPSRQHEALVQALRAAPITAAPTLAEQRANYDATLAANPVPADVIALPVSAGGVPAYSVSVRGVSPRLTILYLHGGGYVIGSHTGYREFAGRLARATEATVCVLDYRLAPEHPWPAAVDDAVAAVRWLRQQGASNLVIAGDSAGGGLTMATLLALRAAGDPMPAGAIALSPWVDLAGTGASLAPGLIDDPLVSAAAIGGMATMYAGTNLTDPLVSPLFGDLHGLPRLLILVGTREVLLDDSRRFESKARAAGVDVTYFEGEDLIHVWPVLTPDAPESLDAMARISAFVEGCLN